MSISKNPYPKFLTDEVSGIELPDTRHQVWAEGYKAGRIGRQMIKTVFKWQNGMVMVFDKNGEQIPKYQGQYEDVEESILKDASPDTIFTHGFKDNFELEVVPREEW